MTRTSPENPHPTFPHISRGRFLQLSVAVADSIFGASCGQPSGTENSYTSPELQDKINAQLEQFIPTYRGNPNETCKIPGIPGFTIRSFVPWSINQEAFSAHYRALRAFQNTPYKNVTLSGSRGQEIIGYPANSFRKELFLLPEDMRSVLHPQLQETLADGQSSAITLHVYKPEENKGASLSVALFDTTFTEPGLDDTRALITEIGNMSMWAHHIQGEEVLKPIDPMANEAIANGYSVAWGQMQAGESYENYLRYIRANPFMPHLRTSVIVASQSQWQAIPKTWPLR